MSLACGTLQGLSRALEVVKTNSGSYPETLASVDESAFVEGDYSAAVAALVLYAKTSDGYIMAVGAPNMAVVNQTGHITLRGPGLTSH